MIIFTTPELVDMNALITFGVSVKESTNPIGQFGTGFKYAVATILRLGGTITVFRGRRRFEFVKKQKEIRDTKFDVVSLIEHDETGEAPQVSDLGFTTQLGNHWLPWMAYRELLCNTVDEGGDVKQNSVYDIDPNRTTIVVDGADFNQEHDARSENFLFDRTELPMWRDHTLEVWADSAPCVYFKRVRAYNDPRGVPFALTYNFLAGCSLTEDRTLKYAPHEMIAACLVKCEDEALLTQILLCDTKWAEHQIVWRWAGSPSDAFVNVVRANVRNPRLNASARTLVQRSKLSLFVDEIELNAIDRSKLDRALWFCKQIGYNIEHPVVVAASLADAGILGYADTKQNKIVLSCEVFKRGTKEVAQTVLEEHIHLKLGLLDESRELQEHLFQLATSLGERAIGEAL